MSTGKPSKFNIDGEIIWQCSAIESSKVFNRLAEKTQVLFPTIGEHEVIRNRLTHSYEVATSSTMMAYAIAKHLGLSLHDVDYRGSVRAASLGHDLGLPPLGHDGQKMINTHFKQLGLDEGFDDNNNNLVVIAKNRIPLSNYTIASMIKYPDRLYPWQKPIYTPMLEDALALDAAHFGALGITLEPQRRTIACQIMDESDRNTYISSDLKDFLSLGNTFPEEQVMAMAEAEHLCYRFSELPSLFMMLKNANKTHIANYFLNLKNRFNENYQLTSKGVVVINEDLLAWREFLWKIEHQFYIKPLRLQVTQQEHFTAMMEFIKQVTEHNFAPSRTYRDLILNAKTPEDRLRAQRDMIAETTDYYAIKLHKKAILLAGTELRAAPTGLQQGFIQPIQPDSNVVMDAVMHEYRN